MRKVVLSLAALAISSFVLVSTAYAQSAIGLEDLNQCRDEIVEFQQAASAYFQNNAKSCSRDPQSDCGAGWMRVANEVAAQDPISFFWTGSDHCEGGSYACFGKGSLEVYVEHPEYVEGLLSRTPEPPIDSYGQYISSEVADTCIIHAWQKRNAHASNTVPVAYDAPVEKAGESGSIDTANGNSKYHDVPNIQLKRIVALGNSCVTGRVVKSVVRNDVWVVTTVEVKNSCATAQIVSNEVTDINGVSVGIMHNEYGNGPPVALWPFGNFPGSKPFPELAFVPVKPDAHGLIYSMGPGDSSEQEYTQGLPGTTLALKTAACDYTGAEGLVNVMFHDRQFTQLVCLPYPR